MHTTKHNTDRFDGQLAKIVALFILLVLPTIFTTYCQTVVYENDFEQKGPQPNFDTSIIAVNTNTGRYLGKFAGMTRQFATLTLTNLPPHQYVTLSFDLLVAMTWDGNGRGYIDTNDLSTYIADNGPDIFKVTADGLTMVHTTFASHDLEFYRFQSFPGTYPQDAYRPGSGSICTNCLGAQWDLDFYWEDPKHVPLPDSVLVKDALYHFDITYTNNTDSTVIVFRTFALTATEFQTDYDEYWGIDNVLVQVSDDPITKLTDCKPITVQSIVKTSDDVATVYVVGEAGTELVIQSSTDILNWVDERVVNFNGFYKNSVSLQIKPPVDGELAAQSIRKNLKIFRVLQRKKK